MYVKIQRYKAVSYKVKTAAAKIRLPLYKF